MINSTPLSTTPYDNHRELGNFLLTRRLQTTPEAVGLPSGQRRRTPGLRREEVAALAHVSPTWYTRLEQGKPIGVSAQVVHGVARALNLSDAEERHLLTLAGLPAASPSSHSLVPDEAIALLEQLNPFPSFVLDNQWNFVAWNHTAGRLYAFDDVAPADRNVLAFLFANPAHRKRLVHWHKEARASVARFRSLTAYAVGEPWFINLVNRMAAISPEFAVLWQNYDVQEEHANPKLVVHPHLGRIELHQTTLVMPSAPGLQIITQLPATERDRQKLVALPDAAAASVAPTT
jgi:transcriptional regulator with XRE-family HTH domain